VNARDAELYGAEIETTVEPLERLVVTARLGWIEGEFQDFTQSVIRNIPGQDIFDPPKLIPVEENFTGNRLPNTPRWKISGIAEYTWDFGRWGSLIPHYDFVWTDDISSIRRRAEGPAMRTTSSSCRNMRSDSVPIGSTMSGSATDHPTGGPKFRSGYET
jgi:hypothetical protein